MIKNIAICSDLNNSYIKDLLLLITFKILPLCPNTFNPSFFPFPKVVLDVLIRKCLQRHWESTVNRGKSWLLCRRKAGSWKHGAVSPASLPALAPCKVCFFPKAKSAFRNKMHWSTQSTVSQVSASEDSDEIGLPGLLRK